MRLWLCIYVKTNPVTSDVVRKLVFFFFVYSVWMLSGHVGNSCCSISFETAEVTLTRWEQRCTSCNLKVWEAAAWWIWLYSALLFVYSLYTEILVCIFKDFLCDIRHSVLNHNNAQLKPRVILCLLLHTFKGNSDRILTSVIRPHADSSTLVSSHLILTCLEKHLTSPLHMQINNYIASTNRQIVFLYKQEKYHV